jgi:hypothetical protein
MGRTSPPLGVKRGRKRGDFRGALGALCRVYNICKSRISISKRMTYGINSERAARPNFFSLNPIRQIKNAESKTQPHPAREDRRIGRSRKRLPICVHLRSSVFPPYLNDQVKGEDERRQSPYSLSPCHLVTPSPCHASSFIPNFQVCGVPAKRAR